MNVIRIIAWTIIIFYALVIVLLYVLQTKLIFYPGKLGADHKFKLSHGAEEVMLKTADGESINGIFYKNKAREVILYFHGNAGDLSGWQYVAEDFTSHGYNFLIIDYRGYGKSSGEISEAGFYNDAAAAYDFLINKGFEPEQILVYGRSIGSGVAVDLAANRKCKGLVLESPFSSLSKLANEKLPFLFPSVFLRYRFDNVKKMNSVTCPVVFLHGSDDTLIPPAHSNRLYEAFAGKKSMIIVDRGAHNDLHAFRRYEDFLKEEMSLFFSE
jgi:fermentation-respiration switch protein FrsA (DUF1100 family)